MTENDSSRPTGRAAPTDAVAKCEFAEVEPYGDKQVILGRSGILDAVQIKTLPLSQK